VVCFSSSKPNALKTERDIKFILAPRLHKTLSNFKFSIMHGIEKLSGFSSLGGNLLCNIALHSLFSLIVLCSLFGRINCIEERFRVNRWLSCTDDPELRMFMQVYFAPSESPFVA